MIYNCRLVPTMNGLPHLGHIYMALVNRDEAHAQGGKFILRLEDTQPFQDLTFLQVYAFKRQWVEDFHWMDIHPDMICSQSEMSIEVRRLLIYLCYRGGIPVPLETSVDMVFHETPWGVAYPYSPYLTATKVIYDCLNLSNLLIRGVDLLGEASHYAAYCAYFGYSQPRQVYLNRLTVNGQEISKTRGNCSLAKFRQQGWTPLEIISILRKGCLIDPAGSFCLSNLRKEPDIPCNF